MRKQVAIVCNKCKTILYNTNECKCKEIATIFSGKFIFLYSDNDNYEITFVYLDGDNVVKISPFNIKDLAVNLFLDDNFLKNLSVVKEYDD